MKVALLTREKNPPVLKRLQLLGARVQVQPPEKIDGLDRISTDLVYLVPFASLNTPGWPEARVLLARGSRFYIVVGEKLRSEHIMLAARDGAHDVVDTSDSDERWAQAITKAAQSQALWWQLYGGRGELEPGRLVGRSAVMSALRESIQRLGPTDATVLIMGESGTGKERIAEALHSASGKEAFVAVNCAAIPEDLLESELFGAEKGAFTGAIKPKPGLVEEAAGGTLFLDEIGEMTLALQPKLLRFLETRRARRVGSTKEYQCDVRVVSATNRDLRREAEDGRFRLDLFYRLAEVVLNAPPLRHRVEDIPDLAQVFLRGASERVGKNFESLEPELIRKFQGYAWHGNIRELKQSIERLAIHYDGPVMRAAWWEPPAPVATRATGPAAPAYPGLTAYPPEAGFAGPSPAPNFGQTAPFTVPAGSFPPAPQAASPYPASVATALPSRKDRLSLARRLLAEHGDDLTWVAAQLGIHPTTLYRWRKSGKV